MSVVISGGQLRQVNLASPGVSIGNPGGTTFIEMDVPHFQALRQETRQFGFLMSPELVYRTQKNVREVVDYLCARFARVPLGAFDKRSETDRVRLPDADPLQVIAREPWPGVPQSRLLPELLRDRLLWDRWVCVLVRDGGGQVRLKRLPPRTWTPLVDGLDELRGIRVGGKVDLPSDRLVVWTGRNGGQSPMRALQAALQELIVGQRYRSQLFEKGGRYPAVVRRPLDAPKLSDPARERLQQNFTELWAGDDSPVAGGVPLLEEGMELQDSRSFSPADQQYLEGVQLGAVQVCNFFHLAPELHGSRAGNLANTDAFRQGLYVETLGPHYTMFEDEFNVQLVPAVSGKPGAYLDFEMDEALRGSFLERAEAESRSTGAPWRLRSEARAANNLPPVDGMDEAIVPLNVIVGGLPSPAATAPDETPFPKSGQVWLPASMVAQLTSGKTDPRPRLSERAGDRLEAELSAYFANQGDVVLAQLGAKADNTPPLDWDGERWDKQLSAVFMHHTPLIAGAAARHALQRIDPDYDWSDDPMLAYLRAGADRTAHSVNEQTRTAIQSEIGSSGSSEWQQRVSAYFAAAATSRAAALARTMTTHVSSFGQLEAGKATGARTKQWHVTSDNPRTSHALLDGVSVPLQGVFPNGLRWPGDPSGSADEVAGCTCTLELGTGGV